MVEARVKSREEIGCSADKCIHSLIMRRVNEAIGRASVGWVGTFTSALILALAACGDPASPFEEPNPDPTGELRWPRLRLNSLGDEVVVAQHLLRARGYGAPADGLYGAATRAATAAFQRDFLLPSSGDLGTLTWLTLVPKVGTASPREPVLALQLLLAARYHVELVSDGVADAITVAALRQFQEDRCLAVSGEVGIVTWNALVTRRSYCADAPPAGVLTLDQAAAVALDAGVPCGEPLAVALAIAAAESALYADAQSQNPATAGCPDGSRDVGLWQINDCYHAEVAHDCALDARCNGRAMATISHQGTDWTPWTTYQTGSYRASLSAASAAATRACR
jgi:peptidoglycan hydrolase-like protein with peptidoglycan-binding domain